MCSLIVNPNKSTTYEVMNVETLIDEKLKRLKINPYMFKLQCNNCGASVNQSSDNHLFRCPYYKSAYYIGTNFVNS